jgi:ribosome-associated protein YbcJ (S4-like RNA binding protein)
MKTFRLTDEYIQLNQLLKAMTWCDNGAEANAVIDNGQVKVNGVVESKLRAWKMDNGLTEWANGLLEVTLAMNTQKHSTIGYAPAELLFRERTSYIDWLNSQKRKDTTITEVYDFKKMIDGFVLFRMENREVLFMECPICDNIYGGELMIRFLKNGITDQYSEIFLDLVVEPGTCVRPRPLGRALGNPKHRGSFLVGQTHKESKFD